MKIKTKLENCYGISSLDYEFDFSQKKVFCVYASNGVMKTSFAKTFMDLSKNQDSKDLIDKDKTTVREIKKDGVDLRSEEIFVVESYNKKYKSDKIPKLLVNQELKEKFDKEYVAIEDLMNHFLESIEELSGLKPEAIKSEICQVFCQGENGKFLESLLELENEVLEGENYWYQNIKYSSVFNDKTKDSLEDQTFLDNLETYVQKYNELLEGSSFFKKGIFNHTQASDVATQLDKNGFFGAEHSVVLNGKDEQIKTKGELEKIITDEKNQILKNKDLEEEFNKLDGILKKNIKLKGFREYLSANPQIISELSNLESFKAKLWKSYFKKVEENFKNLISKFNHSKAVIKKMQKEASGEKGKWHKVIEEFNDKFSVPFTLYVDNQEDVMLNSSLPTVRFEFNKTDVGEEELLEALSQGELRALYILNILFEVEARKNNPCLFIVDDIADSFDYKNKYAIIEYLREISRIDGFYMIILTHNFDFHRSVYGRLDTGREHVLTAIKTNGSIKLEVERYQKNPLNIWRTSLDQPAMLLASIPMVRNLFEYSGKDKDKDEITKFLHIKDGTKELTIDKLKELYGKLFDQDIVNNIKSSGKFYDLLVQECDQIDENQGQLENKIILSICIRLKAEEYMISKINDDDFVNKIRGNQTFKLFQEYKKKFSENTSIKILERVNLMTPENIHLNSFMYEPILDMSSNELIKLYEKVKDL